MEVENKDKISFRIGFQKGKEAKKAKQQKDRKLKDGGKEKESRSVT